MTVRDAVYQGIESAVNRLLRLDQHATARLARDHGRVVAIELRNTGLIFYFVPMHDGSLQLLGSLEQQPDCTISGSPLDLMRATDGTSGRTQLFAGNVSIQGDTGLAQRFSEILGELDIDWEEQLARLLGDIPAHELGRAARRMKTVATESGETLRENLGEYLTEEARLLPHRFEVEAFNDDVDRLRDDVERLAARIRLLEQRNGGKET